MAQKPSYNDELVGFFTKIVKEIYSANRTLEAICRFFQADSGCLWELNKQSNNKVFSLSALYRRPDLVKIIDDKSRDRETPFRLKYDISKDDTISTRIFKDKRSVFGSIGSPPFSGLWLKKEHTFGLRRLKLNNICLIPLFDSEGRAIGSVSLYAKGPIRMVNPEFLADFSIFFSALWETSHLTVEDLNLETSAMRHEITGNILSVKPIISGLERYADPIRNAGNDLIFEQFDDLRTNINSIENSLTESRLKDRININRSNAYYINLQDMLNTIAQPIIKDQSKSQVQLDRINYPRDKMKIFIHPSDFDQIFRNLFNNAVKYSAPRSTIRVSISEDKDGVYVTVSNISFPIDPSEWKLVWNPRFRGSSKNQKNVEGDGLGMYVAKVICKTYGLKGKFFQEPLESKNKDLVWSRVQIYFPSDMVR